MKGILLILLIFWPLALSQESWWENTVIYQIYPRSFQDSDGDGIGDIKGIESRLGHFVELGVQTIWLASIYNSPMKDFGYDISDFKSVDPDYGSIQDFKEMMDKAKALNLKIILDFVPNHSSDEHEWFNKSVTREEPFTDYYVWADPVGFDENQNPIPPNNWVGVFGGSAWSFNENRQQFYLHQHFSFQPDLNFRNPSVVEEMKSALDFWLDHGVDGFTFSTAAFLVEDENLTDEPESGLTDDQNDYDYLLHNFTINQEESRMILKEFTKHIKDFSAIDGRERVSIFADVHLAPESLYSYYSPISDFPLNTIFLDVNHETNADDFADKIIKWTYNIPQGSVANWAFGNHDNWRIATKVKSGKVDLINMLNLALPGIAFTYYGEEIGMTNNINISFTQNQDPLGCKCGNLHFLECSRDLQRTPMQWSNLENSDFSSTNQTWLPINSNYLEINVESQDEQESSHFSIFKKINELRNVLPAFKNGRVLVRTENNVLMLQRSCVEPFREKLLIFLNFNNFKTKVYLFDATTVGKVIFTTLLQNSEFPIGSQIEDQFEIGSFEGIILRML